MRIHLNKFGTILISRQAGKEALAAFQPSLRTVPENEKIEIDFTGVSVFSPSWADEFLTPLASRFNGRLILFETDNLSVKETLKIIRQTSNVAFNVVAQ